MEFTDEQRGPIRKEQVIKGSRKIGSGQEVAK